MARDVLSLKSIYKFLTLNDYPVYSEGIIKKDNRAGLTLNKFYLENILVEFKNGKTGKILWRAEGSRNRYLSEICNRSDRLSIYKEYADEVEQAADYDTVLRQIKQYMSFLLERQYNVENFSKKIPAMLEMYEAGDAAFSHEAAEFFQQAMMERKSIEGQGIMVDTFSCSWLLTMFTIHALMGNGEGEENLHRIRSDKNYTLLEMLKRYQENVEAIKKQAVFYTENVLEHSSPALKPGHFFGREVELFELREMIAQGGKYLISGIAGSGKTELVRQFLKICVEESLVDGIAVFSYRDKLLDLESVALQEGCKNLLIVDGIDGEISEQTKAALCQISATIIATSRKVEIKGFDAYRLCPIGKDAASLIFRDNYDGYLDETERQVLDEILENESWCHPRTLRLLATYVTKNGYTLQDLKQQLVSEEQDTLLQQIYQKYV